VYVNKRWGYSVSTIHQDRRAAIVPTRRPHKRAPTTPEKANDQAEIGSPERNLDGNVARVVRGVFSKNLEEYLKERGITAQFFEFAEHTMTVDAAVGRLGVSRERIIKSMLFIDDSGLPVLGIVTGDRRIDEKKLALACGANKVRRANPAEVKQFTGYDVGAVPPVGHKTKIRTFIDEKVIALDKVIGGGGEIKMLLEIDPADVRRLTNGEVRSIGV